MVHTVASAAHWSKRVNDPRSLAILVWVAIALYVGVFGYLTILKHDAFETTAFDLGNMDQAVWNSIHGRLLPFTNWGDEGTRLAYHVDPILILISPLYLVYSDPRTLLVLQCAVVALGAWPIYLLARDRSGNGASAFVFPLAYLLFPALEAANMFDFHPTTLVAGFLPYAFYFLEKRRYYPFFLFSVLIMACKEEMPLLIVMLGIYALVWQRNWRVGAATTALGVAWFVVAFFVIIPHYNPGGQSPYLGAYEHLGQSPLGLIRTVLTDPLSVFQAVFARPKLTYLKDLFTPVAFLSIFAPQVLFLGLPTLTIILLSADPQVYTLEKFHYPAPLVALVVISASYGTNFVAGWLGARWQITRQQWLLILSGLTLLCTLVYHRFRGFTPLGGNFTAPSVTAHDHLAEKLIALVPQDAIVSAQSKLNPHLSQRERIYMFPRIDDAEYVFFDVTADSWPIHPNDQYRLFQSLISEGDFGILAAEDGYILLRKGLEGADQLPDQFYTFARREDPPMEHLSVIQFGDALCLLGFDLVRDEDMTTLSLYWRALRPLEYDYRIYPHFYDEAGNIIEDTTLRPMTTAIWYPTSLWRPAEIVWMETLPWNVGTDFNVGLGVTRGEDWRSREDRLAVQVVSSTLRLDVFEQGTTVRLAEVRGGEIFGD